MIPPKLYGRAVLWGFLWMTTTRRNSRRAGFKAGRNSCGKNSLCSLFRKKRDFFGGLQAPFFYCSIFVFLQKFLFLKSGIVDFRRLSGCFCFPRFMIRFILGYGCISVSKRRKEMLLVSLFVSPLCFVFTAFFTARERRNTFPGIAKTA